MCKSLAHNGREIKTDDLVIYQRIFQIFKFSTHWTNLDSDWIVATPTTPQHSCFTIAAYYYYTLRKRPDGRFNYLPCTYLLFHFRVKVGRYNYKGQMASHYVLCYYLCTLNVKRVVSRGSVYITILIITPRCFAAAK